MSPHWSSGCLHIETLVCVWGIQTHVDLLFLFSYENLFWLFIKAVLMGTPNMSSWKNKRKILIFFWLIRVHFLEYRIRISINYTGASIFISHILIHPVKKIKFKNFYMFANIYWLYRTSWYVIVKIDFTKGNDVIKPYSIFITIWQSATELTAFSKTFFQHWKICKKKNLSWVWGTNGKNQSLGITVCHHLTSLIVPDSKPWDGFFYLSLTPMTDSYNLELSLMMQLSLPFYA